MKPKAPSTKNPLKNTPLSNSSIQTLPDDIWLDKQDVLQELHISARTLQNWRSKGILSYSKIMGKIYYKKADIQLLLQKSLH